MYKNTRTREDVFMFKTSVMENQKEVYVKIFIKKIKNYNSIQSLNSLLTFNLQETISNDN